MIASLRKLFTPDPVQKNAHDAYVRIVAQARQPVFYKEWQVEDTLDGRFDVILLHLYLVIARCEEVGGNPEAQHFVRILSEVFFSDMDRSLREMGASDTGVGKRIKNMAQAFYGRLKSYGDATTPEGLRAALARNLYREKAVDAEALAHCCAYIMRNRDYLRTVPLATLLKGDITFLG